MHIQELKKLSWNQLQGRYWMVLLAVFLVMVISSASSYYYVGILISGPLFVGQATYLLNIVETDAKGEEFERLLDGFKKSFVVSFLTYLLQMIFIVLWMFLLIIPGIIKALAYSQTFYIIAENPEMSPMDVLRRSEEMMKGHKTRLFLLILSFIGWFLLGALALGIGIFFVLPYFQTTMANFYVDLRGEKKRLSTDGFEESFE